MINLSYLALVKNVGDLKYHKLNVSERSRFRRMYKNYLINWRVLDVEIFLKSNK